MAKTIKTMKAQVKIAMMKEQDYQRRYKDQEHSSLNDKSNLTDLMKELVNREPAKTFASSTTKVESEPPNGSNADITNQCESKQALNVSAGTLLSTGLVLHQMTSDHNRSELGIQDHSNEQSSSKLVPKVVDPHGFEDSHKDGHGGTCDEALKSKNFKEVSVTLITEHFSRSDEVLKLKNFKKDASLKLSSYQIKKGMSMSVQKSQVHKMAKFTRWQKEIMLG
ncbi:hypothetical protein Tco_0364915 [Tanacetum coccineum]